MPRLLVYFGAVTFLKLFFLLKGLNVVIFLSKIIQHLSILTSYLNIQFYVSFYPKVPRKTLLLAIRPQIVPFCNLLLCYTLGGYSVYSKNVSFLILYESKFNENLLNDRTIFINLMSYLFYYILEEIVPLLKCNQKTNRRKLTNLSTQ